MINVSDTFVFLLAGFELTLIKQFSTRKNSTFSLSELFSEQEVSYSISMNPVFPLLENTTVQSCNPAAKQKILTHDLHPH